MTVLEVESFEGWQSWKMAVLKDDSVGDLLHVYNVFMSLKFIAVKTLQEQIVYTSPTVDINYLFKALRSSQRWTPNKVHEFQIKSLSVWWQTELCTENYLRYEIWRTINASVLYVLTSNSKWSNEIIININEEHETYNSVLWIFIYTLPDSDTKK